jgi:hypothetical protein
LRSSAYANVVAHRRVSSAVLVAILRVRRVCRIRQRYLRDRAGLPATRCRSGPSAAKQPMIGGRRAQLRSGCPHRPAPRPRGEKVRAAVAPCRSKLSRRQLQRGDVCDAPVDALGSRAEPLPEISARPARIDHGDRLTPKSSRSSTSVDAPPPMSMTLSADSGQLQQLNETWRCARYQLTRSAALAWYAVSQWVRSFVTTESAGTACPAADQLPGRIRRIDRQLIVQGRVVTEGRSGGHSAASRIHDRWR